MNPYIRIISSIFGLVLLLLLLLIPTLHLLVPHPLIESFRGCKGILFPPAIADAAERKEIVVVMPMAAQNLSPEVRSSLTESFIGELIRSDKYEIVSGKIVADAMTEAFKRQKEKKQQCDELACVREVAGNLGADLVLTIKVVKEGDLYLFNAKIENITSGAQVALKDDECEKCSLSEIKKKVKLLAVRLMGLEGGETSPSVTATAKKPVVEETRESGSSISQTKAPAPVVLQGHLQVNVNAPSARVYVNGEDKGTASPGSPLNMENLPTGTASIRVEAKGYESLAKTVTIQRNQWTQEVFELKRIQVASLPPDKSLQETIRSSDGRYIDNRDGTITDTKTGLMWTKKDSYADLGKCLNWNDSNRYAGNLRTGGYSNWRLPTVDELKAILVNNYEDSKNNKDYRGDTIHIDPIFASGGAYLYWSSDTPEFPNSARFVSFQLGTIGWDYRDACKFYGARVVRR